MNHVIFAFIDIIIFHSFRESVKIVSYDSCLKYNEHDDHDVRFIWFVEKLVIFDKIAYNFFFEFLSLVLRQFNVIMIKKQTKNFWNDDIENVNKLINEKTWHNFENKFNRITKMKKKFDFIVEKLNESQFKW